MLTVEGFSTGQLSFVHVLVSNRAIRLLFIIVVCTISYATRLSNSKFFISLFL